MRRHRRDDPSWCRRAGTCGPVAPGRRPRLDPRGGRACGPGAGRRPRPSRRSPSRSSRWSRSRRSRRSPSRRSRRSPRRGRSPSGERRSSRRDFETSAVVTSGPLPPPISSRRSVGAARTRGANTAVISRPSSPPSASALSTLPTAAASGRRSPRTSPLGRRAPAARHVQVPSSRWLVSSISSRRDTAHKATRLDSRNAPPSSRTIHTYRRKYALCKVSGGAEPGTGNWQR